MSGEMYERGPEDSHDDCVEEMRYVAEGAAADRDEVVHVLFMLLADAGENLHQGVEVLHEILSQRWRDPGSVPPDLASLVRMRMR